MRLWKPIASLLGENEEHGKVTRRHFLEGAAVAASAGAIAQVLPATAHAHPHGPPQPPQPNPFNDDSITFDWIVERWDALDAWGDNMGSLVEITDAKRRDALKIGSRHHAKMYSLGEPMRAGHPTFPQVPPRRADYYIVTYGPRGENAFIYQDEHFAAFTFQQATQIDELNHPSFDGWFYGGRRLENILPRPDITDPAARQAKAAADSAAENYGSDSILGGTTELGLQYMGPMITRGLLLDVLGYKIATGALSAVTADKLSLLPNYRITIADLIGTMQWEGLSGIEPGDVVILRTGWSSYWSDPALRPIYVGQAPGPWLAEAHWLSQFRPAIVASDTYAMEILPAPRATSFAEAHQILMVANGIRIGEGFNTAELAADGVYEFMFFNTPYNLPGATAGGNAPAAVGVPRCPKK